MDLAIEANRNSALFNTMQDVLDVYNPLLHKARPTIVNQTKHRIRIQPTRWANTMSSWNGQNTVRFDLARIGALTDVSLKCAFRLPGDAPTASQRLATGDRGFASATATTGSLNNTVVSPTGVDTDVNLARGRLDRVYADRLLGFNMIKSYTISSKSRRLFTASGEYLLVRFSQMDEDMKKSILDAVTPVDIMSPDPDAMFYAPGITYTMNIPLFTFFNEHITSALDVNFSEEVHIDIELKPPSSLFYYGQLGDMTQRNTAAQAYVGFSGGQANLQSYLTNPNPLGAGAGSVAWDQAAYRPGLIANTTVTYSSGTVATVTTTTPHGLSSGDIITTAGFTASGYNGSGKAVTVTSPTVFTYLATTGSVNPTVQGTVTCTTSVSRFIGSVDRGFGDSEIALMQTILARHIQGVGGGLDAWGLAYGSKLGLVTSGPTFKFDDVSANGESINIQFEALADYIVQDTDAYRALRAQMFPEGSGLTTITYDTSQETFHDVMSGSSVNLLDARSGGTFVDPGTSATGISIGDATRFIDLPIRTNTLAMATHFMVRKQSDLGGSGNSVASNAVTPYVLNGSKATASRNVLGAHQIHTRCLPVHYFQVLGAGRVIYESDGKSQLNLSQSGMYNGTGLEWGSNVSSVGQRNHDSNNLSSINARPFNIYSIPWGLQASRLENTGCLSFQNINNPQLRIYFKPETWAEYSPVANSAAVPKSDAQFAAEMGLRVDIIHEHFNVITINSGNGEITSGLNQ